MQSSTLSTILTGLRRYDAVSIQQMFSLLKVSGSSTMFEFSYMMLPTLYEAAAGPLHRPDSNRGVSVNKSIPRGQGKRQKVGQSYESSTRRNFSLQRDFLLKLVRTMVIKPLEEKVDSRGAESSNKNNTEQLSTQPELIRRLHQLVSFFEQLPIVSDGQQVGDQS